MSRNPVDVLHEQSEVSREIHEKTGAPVVSVPPPKTTVSTEKGTKA